MVTASAAAEWARGAARPLVFTNGVFDILHAGHVELLARASAFGASLVVAVNSDRSARGLAKGSDRPLNTEHDRARVVAAIEGVDRVVVFDEPTPLALIEALGPDVLVKGGDYSPQQIVGADFVRRRGGDVRIVPLVAARSTSALLDRIRGTS